jgi:hypothetical protein
MIDDVFNARAAKSLGQVSVGLVKHGGDDVETGRPSLSASEGHGKAAPVSDASALACRRDSGRGSEMVKEIQKWQKLAEPKRVLP